MGVQAGLHFASALLPQGWARNVRVTILGGMIETVAADAVPLPADERHAIGLPGMANLHSHAFQRAMAGLAETGSAGPDSFWTWRDVMYRFAARIGPQELEAIAALAYAEMLEAGFTRVGEFHYLHHAPDGLAYQDPAAMCAAIAAAAAATGLGLTLLPVYYAQSGFGGQPPLVSQRRFLHTPDSFARLRTRVQEVVAPLEDAVVGVAVHSLRAVKPVDLASLIQQAGAAPFHIHVAEQQQEVSDCLAWSGCRPVQWLLDHADPGPGWCLVHATHMDAAETTALARTGAVAGLCPITEANLGDGLFPAAAFRRAGGKIGLGSDSNVLISLAEELRLLEYGQRLIWQARNVLADGPGHSTGGSLWRACLAGGAQAVGSASGIAAGLSADLFSLRASDPALAGGHGDAVLDGWIFAAKDSLVDCVWRRGRQVVTGGRHIFRTMIEQRYQAVLAGLAG